MDQLVSRLLLYGDLGEESILGKLAGIFQEWKGSATPRQVLVRGIYDQVKRLLTWPRTMGLTRICGRTI